MAVILRELIRSYNYLIYDQADPRTINWPLLHSPLPCLALTGFYLWFVLKAGPAWMKKREPFQLDTLIQVYNLVQVLICVYLTYLGISVYKPWGWYSFVCEGIDWEDNPKTNAVLCTMYMYFLVKILDLLDTVFFVLRKKTTQVTFLHVYHHALMVMLLWFAMRYLPGGQVTFLGTMNCFVHSVMYFYYFLSNYNKEYRKSIWWKKYITQLQIFQFGSIFLHLSMVFIVPWECNFPRTILAFLLPQNLFIFLLFLDFYKKAYMNKPTAQRTVSSSAEGAKSD